MVAVEAELKALVRNPQRIHAALSRWAVGERPVYSDRYFDYPDRGWTRQGSELRVRTVTNEFGRTLALLTLQFLDLGSGIPAVGNVHEVAQEAPENAGDQPHHSNLYAAVGRKPLGPIS